MGSCSTPKCHQRTYGADPNCWYHGRLMAGQIDPYDPRQYPEHTLKAMERAELERLEAVLAGLEEAG
jgi:hypothetical protein